MYPQVFLFENENRVFVSNVQWNEVNVLRCDFYENNDANGVMDEMIS